MKKVLKYPLTILVNVDSEQTRSEVCPKSIADQSVCLAVRLEDGKTVVRAEKCRADARKDGKQSHTLERR